VLRQGRLTPGQERALGEAWPRYGLDPQDGVRDFDAVFGRRAPRVLEIGFGNGEALLAAASGDPARDYIGIEVHRPGVGRLLLNAAKAGLRNLRVYQHDAVEVLNTEIGDGTLAELRLYFPDPWHKARHNKRRIVQPAFATLAARKLAPAGLFHLATDWAPYAEHMFDVMEAAPGFRNRLGPRAVSPRPEWRIETHFQKRGERLGHPVFDLLYDRV
jgi:tRNA (guanine-N7-)-methyltransferase